MHPPLPLPTTKLDPAQRTGLLFGGMGGPDGPDSVVPFLRNLFRDPAVLPLPRPLARLVGALIVRRRASEVRQRYQEMGQGGGSPQLGFARRQCARLEELGQGHGLDLIATPAMRYWHPFSAEAVAGLHDRGARQYLLLPAYPQYSGATSGTILEEIAKACAELAPEAPVHALARWHLLPGYLAALVAQAAPPLERWAGAEHDPRSCALIYAAHSLPERFVRRGDPYVEETRATVSAVHLLLAARLTKWGDWWQRMSGGAIPLLAFQSKVGPVRWVGPDLVAEVKRLGAAGCRRLLVLPVSFTCEHIETLMELDVELAGLARQAGVAEFVRGAALNLDEGWLASLAGHLMSTAFGPGEKTAAGPGKDASRA